MMLSSAGPLFGGGRGGIMVGPLGGRGGGHLFVFEGLFLLIEVIQIVSPCVEIVYSYSTSI